MKNTARIYHIHTTQKIPQNKKQPKNTTQENRKVRKNK